MLAEDSSFFRRTLEMNSNKICNVHKISYYRKQPHLLFFDVFSEELSLTESKKRVIFYHKTKNSILFTSSSLPFVLINIRLRCDVSGKTLRQKRLLANDVIVYS